MYSAPPPARGSRAGSRPRSCATRYTSADLKYILATTRASPCLSDGEYVCQICHRTTVARDPGRSLSADKVAQIEPTGADGGSGTWSRASLSHRPIWITYLPPVRHGYALAMTDTQFRSATAVGWRETLISYLAQSQLTCTKLGSDVRSEFQILYSERLILRHFLKEYFAASLCGNLHHKNVHERAAQSIR